MAEPVAGLEIVMGVAKPPKRANWIGAPEFFNLNQACRVVTEAHGFSCYLVGSALRHRDYRDVDVRCMLDDDEFDRLFPGLAGRGAYWLNAKWSLFCSAISLYLSQHSGLKVDFQYQRTTEANTQYGGPEHPRHAVGMFVDMQPAERRQPE